MFKSGRLDVFNERLPMPSMNIPDRLRSMLTRDAAMLGAVQLSIESFLPVVRSEKMDFFPEYTDHGLYHLEGVLQTASSLIADDAWEVVSPKDVGVLILAVLLHDAGMHITPEGFSTLLQSDWRIDGLDTRSWRQLWSEFVNEARRFDGRTLKKLFGDDARPITAIELDPRAIKLRDRQAIGEFLRRHHHRLAHEIARFGFPGVSNDTPRLQGLSDDLVDLTGLVARSHGLALRSALPYLKRRYDLRVFQDVHAVFLMGVLRIADYLQVQAERAPMKMLTVRRLASPFSQGEWKAHDAIRDVRLFQDDPEAIFLDAAPTDVSTFFRVKGWIDGIQAELDSTWAVMGEVYGPSNELRKLGLVLRRVRSNIEDLASFSASVGYVPVRAAFETAGADLLKLLVTPLYGDRPEFGIRELLQNSLDAVRERELVDKSLQASDDDITIALDTSREPETLTITDKGSGMTAGIITDYFLRAGASFRRSDAWKQSFENTEGKSKVLRSGRFGIGVLAAFLLGDEVHVRTRHFESAPGQGLDFHVSLDSEMLQINKVDADTGTCITVTLRPGVVSKLHESKTFWSFVHSVWDFHCLTQPSVKRTVTASNTQQLRQRHKIPPASAKLPPGWYRLAYPGYEDIHWTYESAPRLACNGILVREGYLTDHDIRLDGPTGLAIRTPNVSVFDPDGNLPLTLLRDRLSTSEFPFEKELSEDVVRAFIASCLLAERTWPPANLGFSDDEFVALRERHGRMKIDPWTYAPDGFTATSPWHLQSIGVSRVVSAVAMEPKPLHSMPSLDDAALVRVQLTSRDDGMVPWLEFVLRSRSFRRDEGPLPLVDVVGTRVLMRANTLKRAARRLDSSIADAVEVKMLPGEGNLCLVTLGECPDDARGLLQWQDLLLSGSTTAKAALIGISEWFMGTQSAAHMFPFSRMWEELIGPRLIPYDLKARRSRLRRAFAALAPYMKNQRAQR
jgi:molecular chaperone HtpG